MLLSMPLAMRYATRLIAVISVTALGLILGPTGAAHAQKLDFNGAADLDLVLPSNQVSFQKGGLGKLEFGGGNGQPTVSGQGLSDIRAQLVPELGAFALDGETLPRLLDRLTHAFLSASA